MVAGDLAAVHFKRALANERDRAAVAVFAARVLLRVAAGQSAVVQPQRAAAAHVDQTAARRVLVHALNFARALAVTDVQRTAAGHRERTSAAAADRKAVEAERQRCAVFDGHGAAERHIARQIDRARGRDARRRFDRRPRQLLMLGAGGIVADIVLVLAVVLDVLQDDRAVCVLVLKAPVQAVIAFKVRNVGVARVPCDHRALRAGLGHTDARAAFQRVDVGSRAAGQIEVVCIRALFVLHDLHIAGDRHGDLRIHTAAVAGRGIVADLTASQHNRAGGDADRAAVAGGFAVFDHTAAHFKRAAARDRDRAAVAGGLCAGQCAAVERKLAARTHVRDRAALADNARCRGDRAGRTALVTVTDVQRAVDHKYALIRFPIHMGAGDGVAVQAEVERGILRNGDGIRQLHILRQVDIAGRREGCRGGVRRPLDRIFSIADGMFMLVIFHIELAVCVFDDLALDVAHKALGNVAVRCAELLCAGRIAHANADLRAIFQTAGIDDLAADQHEVVRILALGVAVNLDVARKRDANARVDAAAVVARAGIIADLAACERDLRRGIRSINAAARDLCRAVLDHTAIHFKRAVRRNGDSTAVAVFAGGVLFHLAAGQRAAVEHELAAALHDRKTAQFSGNCTVNRAGLRTFCAIADRERAAARVDRATVAARQLIAVQAEIERFSARRFQVGGQRHVCSQIYVALRRDRARAVPRCPLTDLVVRLLAGRVAADGMEVLIFFEDELALGFTLSGRDICRHHAVGVRREALGKVGRGGRKRSLRFRGAVNARNAHAHLRGGAEITRQRNRHTGGQIDVAVRVALNARRAGENKIATVLYINRTVTRRRIALD